MDPAERPLRAVLDARVRICVARTSDTIVASKRFVMSSSGGRVVIAALLMVVATASQAILVRAGWENSIPGNANHDNYLRYFSLAGQSRFDTVGGIISATDNGVSGCTGSMISANIVLTAAHCFGPNLELLANRGSDGVGSIAANASIGFATGANLLTSAAYPTRNLQFGALADAVWVAPQYSGTSAYDIALVRLSPSSGSLGIAPTNYLPLYRGTAEVTAGPDFGITIGYGKWGNGIEGDKSNDARVERAGLLEVDLVAGDSTLLGATFYDPLQFATLGPCAPGAPCRADNPRRFPSNFLHAAPARGDSGGPLIQNIGGVDYITGTVHGGGDFYGQSNFWVRTSQVATDIELGFNALAAFTATEVAGTNADRPLLPGRTELESLGGEGLIRATKFFEFLKLPGNPIYLDPVTGQYEEISALNGVSFVSLTVPDALKTLFELYAFDVAQGMYVLVGTSEAGKKFSLSPGVSKLKVEWIEAPGGPVTFGFEFSDDGVVMLEWASVTSVPEPLTAHAMAAGLVMVSLLVARRRRVL